MENENNSKKKETCSKGYRVKAKGYIEQFGDLASARKAFKRIKSKSIKAEEKVRVVLEEKVGKTWEVFEEIKLTSTYYKKGGFFA